jgi:hypothetical protein
VKLMFALALALLMAALVKMAREGRLAMRAMHLE